MEYLRKQDSDFDDEDYAGPVKQLLRMNDDNNIKDVWEDNFQQEMKKMMRLCEKFNVIAMDTQFPGICVTRSANQYSEEENQYLFVRKNVEETRLIQVGFTISDSDGNVPSPICTWQFNFKFDVQKDKIFNQANELLSKAGIKFDKLMSHGIDSRDFAEYFVASGIVFNKNIKWVVFHGSYDFAYLLRLTKGQDLPQTTEQFYKEMKLYFPTIYDLKYIIKDIPALKQVGLNRLGQRIGCCRIGPQHQAGSDSLLTLSCYFRMFERQETCDSMRKKSLLNVIFGIGIGLILSGQTYPVRESRADYLQNYTNQHYDSRNYMINHHHSYGMNLPVNVNPLYQYLQHQQQNGFMIYNRDHRGY